MDTANFVQVLDYKFCEHRLLNAEGVLFCAKAANGAFTIYFTEEPCFKPPVLNVGVGDPISGLIAPLGDAGCWRTIQPNQTGWLYSDGTNFLLAELPTDAGLPDPLQINELIVNDTATIKNLVVGETLCFDALPTGDVVDKVGLDDNGCLVKGNAAGPIAASLYYENSNLLEPTSGNITSSPNYSKTNGSSASIANEIFDSDNITTLLSDTVVKVNSPGLYRIDWAGIFRSTNDTYNVALDLKKNGSSICGATPAVSSSTDNQIVHGWHFLNVALNDTFELRVGKSSGEAGSARLTDVKLSFTRLVAA